MTLTTDSSSHGWGAHIGSQYHVQGVWTVPELDWHINLQELDTVMKACSHFTRHLQGQKVLVQSDNVTVVTYINHQGGYMVQYPLHGSVAIMEVSREKSGIFQGSTPEGSTKLPGRPVVTTDYPRWNGH